MEDAIRKLKRNRKMILKAERFVESGSLLDLIKFHTVGYDRDADTHYPTQVIGDNIVSRQLGMALDEYITPANFSLKKDDDGSVLVQNTVRFTLLFHLPKGISKSVGVVNPCEKRIYLIPKFQLKNSLGEDYSAFEKAIAQLEGMCIDIELRITEIPVVDQAKTG